MQNTRPSQGRARQSRTTQSRGAQERTAWRSASQKRMPQRPPQRPPQRSAHLDSAEYESMSVAELRQANRQNARARQADRAKQARKRLQRTIIIAIVVVVMIGAAIASALAIYNSSLFTIHNVSVSGVEHLTASEMTQLANVPEDTTLLRVDTATIAERVKASAWVDDVEVKRVFPDTLELVVTERVMAAIVEIPVRSAAATKNWAIATDGVWLMPIPERDSQAAQNTSAKIYEDADSVIHIVDVPFGTTAEIGKQCTDDIVNNALAILSGMTTELASQVTKISAAGVPETTLLLASGVEVAFGEAKDIRDKERVVLEILAQNPDNVAYINVRMVETPTWREI